MPAAIKLYSMAVAADVSLKKVKRRSRIGMLPCPDVAPAGESIHPTLRVCK
jgi:hypothetical protein